MQLMDLGIRRYFQLYLILTLLCCSVYVFGQTQLYSFSNQYNWFYQYNSPSDYWVSSSSLGWTHRFDNKTKQYTFSDSKNTGLEGSYIQSHLYAINDSFDISTSYEFLNIFDKNEGKFHSCQIADDKGNVYKYGYHLFHLDQTSDCVWMTVENQIIKYDFKKHRIIETISTNNKSIRFSINDSKDIIIGCPWANGSGIELYSKISGTWEKKMLNHGALNTTICDAVLIDNGELYLATSSGLIKSDIQNLVNNLVKIAPQPILALAKYDDLLFFASKEKGILAYHTQKNQLIQMDVLERLNKSHAQARISTVVISSGHLVVSYEGEGVFSFNLLNQSECIEENSMYSAFDAIASDSGYIYGLKDDSIYKFDQNSNIMKRTRCSIKHSRDSKPKIYIGRQEIIVYTTNSIHIYDKIAFQELYKSENRLSNIYYLDPSASGIYVTSSSGSIEKINLRNHKVYSGHDYIHIFEFKGVIYAINNQGLLINATNQDIISAVGFTNHILRESNFVLLSTNKGVYRLTPSKVEKLMSLNNLASVEYYGTSIDNNGAAWITSSAGIYHLNLQTKSFNKVLLEQLHKIPAFPPVCYNRNVYVKVDQEYVSINEDCYSAYLDKPKLQNISLELDNKMILPNTYHFIPHDYRILLFKYVYNDPYSDKVPVSLYRINANDTTWQKTDSSQINLANLSPGKYDIEIKAIGSNEIESDASVTSITILQPYYLRPWFLISSIFTIFSLGIFAQYLMTKRKLYLKENELEKIRLLQDQRQRLSQDLHDEIGSGLAKIKFLTHNIDQPHHDEVKVNISNLSSSMIESMRDMLWSLDEENDNFSSLVSRLRTTCQQSFRHSDVQLQLAYHGDGNTMINGVTRRHLILIAKEAVTNVLKHANATTVNVSIRCEVKSISFSIQDDGQGFRQEANSQQKSYGISGIHKRVAELKGTISIVGDHGCKIDIVFPL